MNEVGREMMEVAEEVRKERGRLALLDLSAAVRRASASLLHFAENTRFASSELNRARQRIEARRGSIGGQDDNRQEG